MKRYWAAENWLRLRVSGVIVLAPVPAGALAYTNLDRFRHDTIDEAGEDMLAQAKLLAEHQRVLSESTAQTLRVLAQLDAVVSGTPEACSNELRRVNATFAHYHNLGVIDPDGYIRCAARMSDEPVYAGDRDYYQLALANGDVAQGSYQIGRITGLPAVNFGLVSFAENGTLRGVLYAAVAVEAIVQSAERASSEGRGTMIIGAHGEILATSSHFDYAPGEFVGDAILAKLQRGSPGRASLAADGREFVVGFTSLPGPTGPSAFVLVGQSRDGIEASAQAAFVRSGAFLGGALVLSIGAAMVLSERVIVGEHRKRIAARAERIRRLQDADADRIRLVNTIGHDLASPLTPIRLQLHMLGKRLKEEKDARAVEVIHRNFEHIQRLVGDLRDIFKLQAGRLNLTPIGFDLAGLAAEARDTVAPTASARGVEVRLDGAKARPVVADKDRIYQVMMNFLTNAIKFSKEGRQVTMTLAADEHGARLAVRDEGRGLTLNEIDRLFQPFSQVHDRSEVHEKGTGLGLYICRGIIEGHGGRIGVFSEGHGKGSEFWFWLPDEPRMQDSDSISEST